MVKTTYRDVLRPTPTPSTPDVVTKEGGRAYALDPFARLRRFLILGASEGTYYASREAHAAANLDVVRECLRLDPATTIETIRKVSVDGLAPSNDHAIAAIAVAAGFDYGSIENNKWRRQQAYDAALDICRTFTHLSAFIQLRGPQISGRGQRRLVSRWFNRDARHVAYQAVKYPSRDGWSQKDALILAHPTPATGVHGAIFQWIMTGELPETIVPLADPSTSLVAPIVGRDALHKVGNDPKAAAMIVRHYRLPREAVPTELLNSAEVWSALAEDMTYWALLRNLNKLTAVGALNDRATKNRVLTTLTDKDALRRSRVHPLTVLIAARQYAQGTGDKGRLSWNPDRLIVAALDQAFYDAFGNVPSTGKKILLSVDVSSSMTQKSGVASLSSREIAAVMAMVTLDREPNATIVGFSDRLIKPLPIRPHQHLADVVAVMGKQQYGWTHCVLPIKDALDNRERYDAFVSYTDGQTADVLGNVAQTLFAYRERFGPTRHVVVAASADEFSLNDPRDPLSLDVAGFDAGVPAIVADFVSGNLG